MRRATTLAAPRASTRRLMWAPAVAACLGLATIAGTAVRAAGGRVGGSVAVRGGPMADVLSRGVGGGLMREGQRGLAGGKSCFRPFAHRRPHPRHRHAQAKKSKNDDDDGVENVVIVGSGPAGYTAAIYAARANLRPLVFEGFRKGGSPGGQLMTTTEVENFPGFPEGITGPDLMDRMKAQAERWGANLVTEDVENVDLSKRPFEIRSTDRQVFANSIILATGATAKRLGIPREEEFWSRGISSCAICDGASPIFKNQEVAVVGGGDTATEEAIYLTKYASHVHLIVRTNQMRASKAMQERTLNHDSITVHYATEVVDAIGDAEMMKGLKLKNVETGEESELKVRGLFYGIGHHPNSEIVKGQVDLDAEGYVKVGQSAQTSVEGVFAAGDLFDTEWRQAITAAGSGCQAAIAVERYLVEKDLIKEYAQEEAIVVDGEEAKKEVIKTEDEETFDVTKAKHKGQYALRKLYHESDRVLAVLYTSPTCGPCRSLKPILGKLVDEFESDVHYVEIDIVKDADIAEAAGVTGTPTVQFFKDKSLMEVVAGVKMKKDYREIINKALEKEKVPEKENA